MMADDLVEVRKKFKLTDEEEVAVDIDELPSEDMGAQVALSLIEKLFRDNQFNVEAMKNVLKATLKPRRGLIVREIEKNLSSSFFSEDDRTYVLANGPWAFDWNLVLLRELLGHEQPE